MATKKKLHFLQKNPHLPFGMRFTGDLAPELIEKLLAEAARQQRTFPATIQHSLMEHFKIK